MGKTFAGGGSGTVAVNVRPTVKTTDDEAGKFQFNLPDGTEIVNLAHILYPCHDRSFLDTVLRYLEAPRKHKIVLVLSGGLYNEEALKWVADDDGKATRLAKINLPPEIEQIKEEYASVERRFLAVARLAGRYAMQFANACDQTYVLPSVSGGAAGVPTDYGGHLYAIEWQEKQHKHADRHPGEIKKGKVFPTDFGEFVQLEGKRNVMPLAYGQTLTFNDDLKFKNADFERRHPGTAAWVDVTEGSGEKISLVRSDGLLSSSWKTTPVGTYPSVDRTYSQAHQPGHCFDLSQGLGHLKTYKRRAKGFWHGVVVNGRISGAGVPLQTGADGRRSFSIWGVPYTEKTANACSKVIRKGTPASLLPPAKPKAAIKSVKKPVRRKKK
ncbi:MAG: hypothetical protein K2W82_15925 [Candidatus Obscuribacterales bacterium]|nr:hypothetical protein [Candidatus Obscuribacterales bacterium]